MLLLSFFETDQYGDVSPMADLAGAFLGIAFLIILSFIVRKLFWGLLVERSAQASARIVPPIPNAKVRAILESYFPYYQGLDQKRKRDFLLRVETFIMIKSFIPRKMLKNEDINILIAATAAQLSFGLKSFEIFSFERIVIYPDKYFSEIRGTYHKGEVNVEYGLVILSANNFLKGIQDPNDGINLGLHEFSHALNIDAFKTRKTGFVRFFEEWKYFAEQEMERVKLDQLHFLRGYAGTNIQEMFAVCTENFFERPQLFKQELPYLFNSLVKLYQQDPSRPSNPLEIT